MVRTTWKWIAVGCVLLGAAGSAVAQPTNANPRADAESTFQRRVQLSPAEELNESEGIVTKMELASTLIRHQLEQARTQRDVVRTLCLNDKLSQIDVAVRSAHDRKDSLRSASARSDNELANHEFTIMTVLRQRSEQLVAEANQCIGEETAFVGQTQVVTQVDPNLPSDDNTSYPPTNGTLVSAPPTCVTCVGH
jgi:hypothetical protein